jgi:hypothetical protein
MKVPDEFLPIVSTSHSTVQTCHSPSFTHLKVLQLSDEEAASRFWIAASGSPEAVARAQQAKRPKRPHQRTLLHNLIESLTTKRNPWLGHEKSNDQLNMNRNTAINY